MKWLDWYQEGAVHRKVDIQHGTGKKGRMLALATTHQPDRDAILEDNKNLRQSDHKHGDLSFGRRVGRIPIEDYQFVLPRTHPELFEGDPKDQQMAWVRFINSPEGEKYKLRQA